MRRRSVSAPVPGHDEDEAGAPLAQAPRPEPMRTEFEFVLPRGYVDSDGVTHREGTMRLATARDELIPLIDVRVKENPAYLSVVLLGLVITKLGTVTDIHAGLVERMFASDIAFLQDFYRRINSEGHTRAAVSCPDCGSAFEVDIAGERLGES
ncbi:phage tail assembly protein [Amycolatopsis minnesotensis]|uniref:Secreted protein n=1 Tax=Amycolatopsis minnesotensis TaxID=337894 RepID=A0ABN2QBA5_9PSEU